ncbi:hypothetical protein MNQ96_00865 [Sphingopyxis granuli]|nr:MULTISPECIES: hypothetical protein [Sphingopyxis]UNK79683.1 hypothetical protein MNQ96_00865 [Sphingopyxis granuli]
MIFGLHRIALDGLSSHAGNFRPPNVSIGQSKHTRPPAYLLPSLIQDY